MKKRLFLKRLGILFIFLYVVLVVSIYALYKGPETNTYNKTIKENNGEETGINIEISALSKTVTFRGIDVMGKWYNPNDIIIEKNNWIENPNESTYTSVDSTPLVVKIPNVNGIHITFNTGPEQGIVQLKVGNQTIQYDLSAEEFFEQGLAFELPQPLFDGNSTYSSIQKAVLFLLIIILLMLLTIQLIKRHVKL